MKELISKYKKQIAVYAVWFFINFVILVMAIQDRGIWGCSEQFYPFTNCKIVHAYDYPEFLVYGIGPALLLMVYLAFKDQLDAKATEGVKD